MNTMSSNLLQQKACLVCQTGRRIARCSPFSSISKCSAGNIRPRWFRQAAIYWFSILPTSNYAFDDGRPYLSSSMKDHLQTRCFWTEGISYRKKKEQDSQPILYALENLVSRLGEFTHNLQVPASNPALMDSFFEGSLFPPPSSSPAFEEEVSVEELAKVFCQGYANLAPLELSSIATAASPQDTVGEADIFQCPRGAILFFLAQKCGPPGFQNDILSELIPELQNKDPSTLKTLQKAWTPLYEELFQCLLEQNSQDAVSFLVELRGDLLRLLRTLPKEEQASLVESFKELERHIRRLLSVWFSPGLLEIRRVTYDTTSAGIIEKIALKEAVHPMKSLDDLRQRLGPKRRVFALFHPLLQGEPLVILHVHLETKPDQIPSAMKHVLSEEDGDPRNPEQPLVATFYSISNTKSGLGGGLGLGEYVIKEAVQLLRREFGNSIETFVTLSPMPTFRKWVEAMVPKDGEEVDDKMWARQLRARGDLSSDTVESLVSARSGLNQLIRAKKFDELEEHIGKLEPLLTRLAAQYLVVAKKGRSGKPLDAVTGFHVGNGAEVYRVNFGADFSRKGLLRSFGVMVNYRYPLDDIAQNKARFESSQFIPMTPQVEELLKDNQ